MCGLVRQGRGEGWGLGGWIDCCFKDKYISRQMFLHVLIVTDMYSHVHGCFHMY
jgi:hypothetical protein